MPSLDSKSEYVYRRAQMNGFVAANQFGPLTLPVSRELRNRKLYFSCNWQGYTDWKASATLTLLNGTASRQVFRFNWGSVYSNQASSVAWQGTGGEVGNAGGGPSYSVDNFDPVAFPNGPSDGSVDAIRITGMSNVDGLRETGYSAIMYPFSWFGSVDSIVFQWVDILGRSSATPSITSAPFVEIYVGCKSIVG